jgi:transcriptional regulator with XRE-family HTH domain
MGRASRRKRHYPKRLGEKLRQIRTALGLSQTAMLERLGNPEGILGTSISAYERGGREPPLLVLLEYARVAGVCVDSLLDDNLNLPDRLPDTHKHRVKGRRQTP